MTGSTSGHPILAEWTLDAGAWRAFLDQLHARAQQPGYARAIAGFADDASEAERTVTAASDSILVGKARFDLNRWWPERVVEHAAWIEFFSDPQDEPTRVFLVPFPPGKATQAAQVAAHFRALMDERDRRVHEELTRPTPSNRLLWFVERHFIALLLVFFFVLLPLGAVLVAWLAGEPPAVP
jgi:hypothetical protein